jgi:hypothetical protein
MTDTFEGKEIYKSFLELNCLEFYKALHFACEYNLCVFVWANFRLQKYSTNFGYIEQE